MKLIGEKGRWGRKIKISGFNIELGLASDSSQSVDCGDDLIIWKGNESRVEKF